MVTININGCDHQVPEGQNLLQACLSLGYDLPYFCWHPALGSVGACRQCAVKSFRNPNDTRGELVMACMTPAAEGARILIDDPEAMEFRASVIEWLMINHPHDCPVCDEGGECHLQDMTVMTGHNLRRHRFNKRTHRNQDLGPFISHEMNRCIQCYRCVRFYREYAGGRDLDVFASRDRVYFGRASDGPLESEFSGNLVEICPTGVFTDRTFGGHFTRSWDLQTAASVCVHCGLGCNTLAGARSGVLRRVRNRYHHQVNGFFLCDRGRFGYEFVNGTQRIRRPLVRRAKEERLQAGGAAEALQLAASFLAGGASVIGIGSPRASLESNFALRQLVGPERFHAGMAEGEGQRLQRACSILRQGTVPSATLQAAGLADAALVLGEDVTQTAPLLALNLRRLSYHKAAEAAAGFRLPSWNDRAVRLLMHEHPAELYVVSTGPTRLDDAARCALRLAPDELSLFAAALWASLDAAAPPATGLGEDLQAMVEALSRALRGACRPLVVAGTASGPTALVEAAANIAWSLKQRGADASLFFCAPECNSMGLAMMDARPLADAFACAAGGGVDTLVILENDLYRRAAAADVDRLLRNARRVIVVDHARHPTAGQADVVLPSATFAECSGTLVNSEGRAQRSHAVMPPEEGLQAPWRWLQALGQAAGAAPATAWTDAGDVLAGLAAALPDFGPAAELAAEERRSPPPGGVARQSHRYSGRTALTADVDIHEPKPPADPDSPLNYSMEGYQGPPPAAPNPRPWAPGWNSVQALNKFRVEVGGPLSGVTHGRRLIQPPSAAASGFFDLAPPARRPAAGEHWAVALHHIFGSEELSMAAPAVAKRAPAPYLALAPSDPLAVAGKTVCLRLAEQDLELPVRIVPGLPEGVAGLPAGLPGLPGPAAAELPAVVQISRGR